MYDALGTLADAVGGELNQVCIIFLCSCALSILYMFSFTELYFYSKHVFARGPFFCFMGLIETLFWTCVPLVQDYIDKRCCLFCCVDTCSLDILKS